MVEEERAQEVHALAQRLVKGPAAHKTRSGFCQPLLRKHPTFRSQSPLTISRADSRIDGRCAGVSMELMLAVQPLFLSDIDHGRSPVVSVHSCCPTVCAPSGWQWRRRRAQPRARPRAQGGKGTQGRRPRPRPRPRSWTRARRDARGAWRQPLVGDMGVGHAEHRLYQRRPCVYPHFRARRAQQSVLAFSFEGVQRETAGDYRALGPTLPQANTDPAFLDCRFCLALPLAGCWATPFST